MRFIDARSTASSEIFIFFRNLSTSCDKNLHICSGYEIGSITKTKNIFPSIMLPATGTHIEFAAGFLEEFAHLFHAFQGRRLAGFGDFGAGQARRQEAVGGLVLLRGEVAHFLRDLHRAEFGAAHGAEMRRLGAFGRQGLIMILFGRVGIERQVELVAPAEFEAGAAERVVADLGLSLIHI